MKLHVQKTAINNLDHTIRLLFFVSFYAFVRDRFYVI